MRYHDFCGKKWTWKMLGGIRPRNPKKVILINSSEKLEEFSKFQSHEKLNQSLQAYDHFSLNYRAAPTNSIRQLCKLTREELLRKIRKQFAVCHLDLILKTFVTTWLAWRTHRIWTSASQATCSCKIIFERNATCSNQSAAHSPFISFSTAKIIFLSYINISFTSQHHSCH